MRENGTPAQKKMATFALNARHWKHGLGGPLIEAANIYDGTTEDSQQMNIAYAPNAVYGLASSSFILPEITVTGKNRKKSIPRKVLEAIKDIDLAYLENPSVMTAAGHTANISGMHAPTEEERRLADNLAILGEAGLMAPTLVGDIGATIQAVRHPIQTVKAVKNIIKKSTKETIKKEPDLVWDAEQMFRDGNNYSYTPEDVDILNGFIPEYKEIERASKANGTYLKMSDGTTWKGDPREWVIAQSKNVKANYGDEILTYGNSDTWINKAGVDVSGDILGEKTLWTSTNPYLGGTYGNKRYRFVIPKDADIKTVADAEGRYWRDVKSGVRTDDVVYPILTEDNVVRVNNVVDRGPNNFFRQELPKPLPNESLMDYNKRVFIGDDLVLGKNVPRKALLGNNGMFDISSSNIFKGLTPVGFGIPAYNKLSKHDGNK